MTFSKRFAIIALASAAAVGVGDLAEDTSFHSLSVISAIVSPAEARVGRPLTPVSVAGAARRTTRRCAAGVYNC
jgi:hypothetical protein